MPPIPRCDLRLPTMDCKKSRLLESTSNQLHVVKSSPMKQPAKQRIVHKKAEVQKRRQDDAEPSDDVMTSQDMDATEVTMTTTTTEPPSSMMPIESMQRTDGTTTLPPGAGVPVGCLPTSTSPASTTAVPMMAMENNAASMKSENTMIPMPAEGVTRDTAEAIIRRAKFKKADGEVTRDTAESIMESARLKREVFGEENNPVCTTGEEEALTQKVDRASCPGTPGDASQWILPERNESPEAKIKKDFMKTDDETGLTLTQLEEKLCKKRIRKKKYIKMWGSEEAVRRWKKYKLEARRKRRQLEKRHAQNSWLRERMRNHARKKRRMYRCKDQSKIPSLNEDIQINKAFYFRFNYNNQVPCMPSNIDQHMTMYNKPPFQRFATSGALKQVDEFEKLRVMEKKNTMM